MNSRAQRRIHAGAVCVLVALATGCAPFRQDLPADPVPTIVEQGSGALIAQWARAQIGVPYRYGGGDPQRGFDCSGLVSFAHAQEGLSVPRTAAAQFGAARKVALAEVQPGDLLFYRLAAGSKDVTHVGIYTGQGRFVHAPQTGKRVDEASIADPYYRERFAGAGRLYPEGAGAGPRLNTTPR